MKTCPNCGETLGTHADSCFKCRYSFKLHKVMTVEECDEMEEMRLLEIQKKHEYRENQRKREIEAKNQRLEFIQQLPRYEYATEIVRDTSNGVIDAEELNSILERYSKDGWRLHTAISNEIRQKSYPVNIGVISTDITSTTTIGQTILIFERLIAKGTL